MCNPARLGPVADSTIVDDWITVVSTKNSPTITFRRIAANHAIGDNWSAIEIAVDTPAMCMCLGANVMNDFAVGNYRIAVWTAADACTVVCRISVDNAVGNGRTAGVTANSPAIINPTIPNSESVDNARSSLV